MSRSVVAVILSAVAIGMVRAPTEFQHTPSSQLAPASQAATRRATQPSGEAQTNADPAAQLALARARTDAHLRLASIELQPGLSFGHWIARDRETDSGIRAWIWSRPAGRTRVFGDGVVEVDVLLPTPELLDRLRSLAPGPARGGTADSARDDCYRLLARVPWLCGRGSVRPGERATRGAPAGWEDVPEADREAAGRAAVAAAAVALFEQVSGERLTTSSLVRDFLESDAGLREAALRALATCGPRVAYLPHQAARAELSISRAELLRLLTGLHAEHYRGTEFRAEHFRDFALLLRRDRFVAEGEAPPPSHAGLTAAPLPGLPERVAGSPLPAAGFPSRRASATGSADDVPRWAAVPLRVTTPRGADEAAVQARVEQAAENLVLARGVTLGQFIQFHPELRADYLRALSGACPVIDAAAAADEVIYEAPLDRVWEIIRSEVMETGGK